MRSGLPSRLLTRARVASQPKLAFLDEQFGFSASAVNDGVKILHFGYLEGRHHVAHLQSSYEASLPALRCAMVAYL